MPISAGFLLACLLLPAPPFVGGVDGPLARPELKGARVALCVVDVDSGQRLFARNADEPMAPASNLKLVTTAAAIGLLGPDYQFSTRLLTTEERDAEGVLHGDLVVVGGGDPCLRADLLAPEKVSDPGALLADLVAAAGVKRVDGKLVLDDGLMDHEWLNPDWNAGDIDADYAAPIGALSLHKNCLALLVDGSEGPAVATAFAAPGYTLRNELKRADVSNATAVSALRPDSQSLVRVRGEVGRSVSRLQVAVPVRDPTELFGRCLLGALQKREIPVSGGLSMAPGCAAALDDSHLLTSLQTPLQNAVLIANKESDNSISDHLFKLVGTLGGGPGSFASGAQAVLGFLSAQVGTSVEGVVLRDGSGLSSRNRVTARLIADTLVHMWKAPAPARDLYLRSLPVAGIDGSLAERLEDAPYRGAVRAKTGYIRGVSTLSGYARTTGGRTLAFSILINDFGPQFSNRQMKAIEDDVCRALVDLR